MSVSLSTTRFVMKLAPTVLVVWAGLKAPLQYLVTSDVLPTPWAPRTTILASSEVISMCDLYLVSCIACRCFFFVDSVRGSWFVVRGSCGVGRVD